ncbi:MAG: hypothetical protein P4L31_00750 [Candidatus Babeliales bacterium]|nr:hypothetical protein [Candidatus Babeliales bacterium]
MINKKFFKFALLMTMFVGVHKSSAMNLLMPYDTLIRPQFRFDRTYHLEVYGEHGFNAKGFNECNNRVNVLQIWNRDQDALKMLQGFPSTSQIGQLAIDLRADGADDDGVRGHYNVCGDLSFNAVSFDGRYHFLHNWWITGYLPVYNMSLKDVSWQNQTLDVSSGDQSVREKLTDDFFCNVKRLGSGLELGDWNRTGLGDITVMIEWMEDFWQAKPLLKKVRTNWRLGFNLPTGLKIDEDKIFTIPFGYDGAFGVIFGFGLDLDWGQYVKVGGDVQLHHRFGNTRCRRIKTDFAQTELLLLQKTDAYIDFGMIQRFNLYAQAYNWHGLALKFGYQFYKRGDNIISLSSECFSTNIANSAESLQEFTLHQAILTGVYDFSPQLSADSRVKPSLELYARLPFNGQRVALSNTFGAVLAFDF